MRDPRLHDRRSGGDPGGHLVGELRGELIERRLCGVLDLPDDNGADLDVFFEIPFGDFGYPFVVLWLIFAALVFTVYFGFIQARGFSLSLEIIRGKFSSKSDPGEVTHFQALASALSGTVGLGNIAGVDVAVALGGPGATF